MDPRLFNAYHDDLFESNLVKCHTQSQFWADDVECLETQLVDGILPSTPLDVTSSNLFSNLLFKEENYSPKNNNSILNDSFEDGKLNNDQFLSQQKNKTNDSSLNSIDDIYNYNDNDINNYNDYDYDSDSDSNSDIESDTNNDNTDANDHNTNDDDNISYVSSSFRSRTDSSSIGDYESHSSDYDDDDDEDDEQMDHEFVDDVFESNGIKKIKDDADPFAMQLDVTTFDLATFITEDDHVPDTTTAIVKPKKVATPVISTIPLQTDDTDSDSDVIVDVETVDNDDIMTYNQENIEDDERFLKKQPDPSLNSINKVKNLGKNEIKVQTILPGKKIGIGRGKNLKMFENPAKVTPKSEVVDTKSKQIESNKLKNDKIKLKTEETEQDEEENKSDLKNSESNLVNQAIVVPIQTQTQTQTLPKTQTETFPIKRKLNLEEYKKRRENPSLPFAIKKTNNITQQTNKIKTEPSQQTSIHPTVSIKSNIIKSPKTNEVTSIVKSLKENQLTKKVIDPITEAKNKVLRMQELKKAQHIKIIDSTVSRKVGRVTKLPPLKDIVKDSYKIPIRDNTPINNSEYEEIVIVSVGCNTDITHTSNGNNMIQQQKPSNSLLKCNNLNNSLTNLRPDERLKMSNDSPLSIENNAAKKTINPSKSLELTESNENIIVSEHGEDKIIMHLRKDRIRKPCISQSTQTEDLLSNSNSNSNSVSKSRRKYRSRQRSHSSDRKTDDLRSREISRSRKPKSKYRRRSYRNSISSSYSESEDSSIKRNHRYKSSSRERSISSNDRRYRRTSFDRIYNRRSRSRSKTRSRSRSRSRSSSRSRSRRRMDKNVSAPAVEERRIVYVGRIEPETTKEILRRKFIPFGPIKNITIHYKDTGMKYGFVTFEKSEDAFRVIDSGSKNESIQNYDISFGGRRAFCRTSYADLDSAGTNYYQGDYPPRQAPRPKEDDSFEALLLKMKAKLNATKSKTNV